MEWQNSDPRIRQRLQPTTQSPTFTHQNSLPITNRPLPVQYDQYSNKRQLSNPKDPRMKPDNMKRLKYSNATAIPTPFGMKVVLYNGGKFVATVSLEGKQTCFHEVKVK